MTPELAIVVDTEEEFDWGAPFSRASVATSSIPAQARAHEIYDRFGVVPTYVVDHPVATDPAAAGFLRGLMEEGKAEIGAHLHPWVTPPHDEAVTARNSYHCNLPPPLERAKIEAITAAVERGFGRRPTVFKAGRHGFGPNTASVLAELGYEVDCSFLPLNDLSGDGGPDYRCSPLEPFWLDEEKGLLEVPVTSGYIGRAAGFGATVAALFDSPRAQRLHLPGLLARAGLVARSRLTPEGVSAAEQCRLIETLAARGQSVFTMVYHSPSLEPGHTPYVRDEAGLERFLGTIEEVLTFFREGMGGRFTTLSAIRRRLAPRRRSRAA